MRAVSFASGVVGLGAADAVAVVPIGRGKGVLVIGGGGGGGGAAGGGGAVRGKGTPASGGVGNGFCDIGGLGTGTFPGFGTRGADVGGGSEVGGREGRLIRTVSSSSGVVASPRRGGRVIRTVSFFGSFASAMVTLAGGISNLSEISRLVTAQFDARAIKNPVSCQ